LKEVNARILELEFTIQTYETIIIELNTKRKFEGDDPNIYKLEQSLNLYQEIDNNLSRKKEILELVQSQNISSLTQFSPAAVPAEPISPNMGSNVVLGALGGLFLSILIISAREMINKTRKSGDS
jgi:uncharacterized protein involved in exopolysaccharide biosynthesis